MMKRSCIKIIALLAAAGMCFSSCSLRENAEYALSNAGSAVNTRAVYAYLCEAYSTKVLSAQQESTWIEPEYELNYIQNSTGKLPAIYGFDYMNDDFAGVNERAEKWAAQGGIVTVCWHTGADFTGEWSDSQKDEIADWNKIFQDGSEENKQFLAGMDKAAAALKELQEKNITVLWRPFHEFDGQWFWWGKGGAENFKKLWRMMYERYTNHWQLDNLIWVLGYSHVNENQKDWYPGDAYCDIVGADCYEDGLSREPYKALKKVTKSKPLCFHECGTNPTVNELESTPWNYFMTWHTSYLLDNNTPEQLNALYNSETVITLDELPEF